MDDDKINKKESNKKKIVKIIISISLIPGVVIFILSVLIKINCFLGDWILKYFTIPYLSINTKESISLGDFIYYYFTFMAIEVTGVLSWALLQASEKSNQLSELIENREFNRDDEKNNEVIMTLYYELLSKISILKNLYVKIILNKEISSVDLIDIKGDWIKDISNLHSFLNKREQDLLFNLYEDLASLQKAQEIKNKDIERDLILNISDKLFINVLKKYLWMDFTGKIDCILSSKYYIIFRKLEAKINNQTGCIYKNGQLVKVIQFERKENDIKEIYIKESDVKESDVKEKLIGEFVNGDLKNGEDVYYDENGHQIYSLTYKDYKVVKGSFCNYINDSFEKIFAVTFDYDEVEDAGYIIQFYDSNRMKYKGGIKNKKYDDRGVLYGDLNNKAIIFDGHWVDGNKKKGIYKSYSDKSSIISFKGDFNDNRPYTGEIKIGNLKTFRDAYEYNGTIEEGKLNDGFGYLKNISFIDWDYVHNHSDEEQCHEYIFMEYENDCDYEEYHDEIPDDVKQQMHEDDIRRDNQRSKGDLSDICIEVVELIETQWENGVPKKAENDDLNKKYFGLGSKKKSSD